jgi:2-phosphosulfolactate phosphatase
VLEGIDGARAASGVVVVIDVMRAFTTAACAFAAGIDEIELVGTVEQALAVSGFKMGEVGGRLIPGFDHNNSPSQLVGRRLSGRAVMRTGAGTRCVVEAVGASEVWIASLVVASATAAALADRPEVTFVASGCPDEGEEDIACAEFIASQLEGSACDRHGVVARVLGSRAAARHHPGDSDFPPADLPCVTAIDAFDFAMKVHRRVGRLVATRHEQRHEQPRTPIPRND